jgi:hypothetical protein
VVVKAAMDMLVLVTPVGQVVEEVDPPHPEAPWRQVDLELRGKEMLVVTVPILVLVMDTDLEVVAVVLVQLAVQPVAEQPVAEEQD